MGLSASAASPSEARARGRLSARRARWASEERSSYDESGRLLTWTRSLNADLPAFVFAALRDDPLPDVPPSASLLAFALLR